MDYLIARIVGACIYMVSSIVTLAVTLAMALAAIFIPYGILRLYLA